MSKSKTSPKPAVAAPKQAIPPPPPAEPLRPAPRTLSDGHVSQMFDEAREAFARPVPNSSVFATPTLNGTGDPAAPRFDPERTLPDTPKALRGTKKLAVRCRMVFKGPIPTHDYFVFVDDLAEIVHVRGGDFHTETVEALPLGTPDVFKAFATIGLL